MNQLDEGNDKIDKQKSKDLDKEWDKFTAMIAKSKNKSTESSNKESSNTIESRKESKDSKERSSSSRHHHHSSSRSSHRDRDRDRDYKDKHHHKSSSHHRKSSKDRHSKRHIDEKKSRRSSSRSSSRTKHSRSEYYTKERSRERKRDDKILNEIKDLNKSVTTTVTSTDSSPGNIVEMLKQIEVPKELRFNSKEAAKYQMEQLRKKTEELTGVKVPSFYSTTAINPLAYAEQQKKRKLLWSKPKESEKITTTGIVGRAIVDGQDEKTAEKFRKLMGIKTIDSSQTVEQSVDQIQQMQKEAFEQMDKEYQLARMTTHTHRGMGLGFASTTNTQPLDPNIIQKAAQLK